MRFAVVFTILALSACADSEDRSETFARCWGATEGSLDKVVLTARGVFVPRHGAILIAERCRRTRLSLSGDVVYRQFEVLAPNRLSTAPIPFTGTFIGTVDQMQGPNGDLIVERVEQLSSLTGPKAADLLVRWESVD